MLFSQHRWVCPNDDVGHQHLCQLAWIGRDVLQQVQWGAVMRDLEALHLVIIHHSRQGKLDTAIPNALNFEQHCISRQLSHERAQARHYKQSSDAVLDERHVPIGAVSSHVPSYSLTSTWPAWASLHQSRSHWLT